MNPAPRVLIYGPDGHFMATAPAGYVQRAVVHGELTLETPEMARVRASALRPLVELSPEVRRRLHLAKEQSKGRRR